MILSNITKKVEMKACKNKILFRIVKHYYTPIVIREIECANVCKNDCVLYIGGGPCPVSALLTHEFTGAKITVLDNDKTCVCCSKKLINKKGLSDKIDVIYSDAETFDPSGYDVIHVASQIVPKDKVFESVWKSADDGCVILTRVSRSSILKPVLLKKIKDETNKFKKVKHGLLKNVHSTAICVKL